VALIHHPYITGTLLAIAVGLAIVCSIGVMVMRDPFQRMHFTSPVTTWSVFLIIVAVWVEATDWQARIKVLIIGLILLVMNAILTHSSARAIRIQQVGHYEPRPEEKIPIVEDHGIAGGTKEGKKS
jgi:monovalent cation/proton antiporter MnhG/PhaG subunit